MTTRTLAKQTLAQWTSTCEQRDCATNTHSAAAASPGYAASMQPLESRNVSSTAEAGAEAEMFSPCAPHNPPAMPQQSCNVSQPVPTHIQQPAFNGKRSKVWHASQHLCQLSSTCKHHQRPASIGKEEHIQLGSTMVTAQHTVD